VQEERGEDRGLSDVLERLGIRRTHVPVEQLQQNIKGFLDKMRSVVEALPDALGAYRLEEITLSVEVTAKGQVGLLGTGGEVGGKGGLTFALKRKAQA
jgi:hypothetical protein